MLEILPNCGPKHVTKDQLWELVTRKLIPQTLNPHEARKKAEMYSSVKATRSDLFALIALIEDVESSNINKLWKVDPQIMVPLQQALEIAASPWD